MLASAAILLLVAQAAPKFSLDFKNEPVENVLRIVDSYAKARVDLAPEYAGRSITIKAQNATVPEALKFIAEDLGGEAKAIGEDRYRIAPAWQHAILEKLEKEKAAKLVMEGVELGQALKLFRSQCAVQVHCTLDPKTKIRFSVEDGSYRAVLDAIAEAAGGAWELRYGVPYLATRTDFERMPLLPPKLKKDPALPLHLQDRTLVQALGYLEAASGRAFVLPELVPERKVTAMAKSVTLSQALALVLYPVELSATESEKGAIVVAARKK